MQDQEDHSQAVCAACLGERGITCRMARRPLQGARCTLGGQRTLVVGPSRALRLQHASAWLRPAPQAP
jgi:hypothetical protein